MSFNTRVTRKTNNRRKRGVARDLSPTTVNLYPTDPAARRRLNSQVNNQHARIPVGWVSDKGSDCDS